MVITIILILLIFYSPVLSTHACIRGGANVQSTQKWDVNNLFVQSIFQFCAVNFFILSNNICTIQINF